MIIISNLKATADVCSRSRMTQFHQPFVGLFVVRNRAQAVQQG